jgi:hypothetical protein
MESEFYFSNEVKRSFYFRHENSVIFLQILPKFLIYYCRLRLFICCISLVKIFFYYILRQKISNKSHRNPHLFGDYIFPPFPTHHTFSVAVKSCRRGWPIPSHISTIYIVYVYIGNLHQYPVRDSEVIEKAI